MVLHFTHIFSFFCVVLYVGSLKVPYRRSMCENLLQFYEHLNATKNYKFHRLIKLEAKHLQKGVQ